MGIQERRLRDRETLRRKILDAARELFVEEGYEAFSMRRLAERIEYSPTTIYLHFTDKAELFNAICEETFAQLVRRLAAIERRGADRPLECLREGLHAYIDFGLKHPHHYTVTFVLSPQQTEEYRFEGSAGEQAFGFLSRAVERCVEAKAFRPVETDAAAQTLWAGVHGLTSLLIAHQDFPFVAKSKLVGTLIECLIRGFQK